MTLDQINNQHNLNFTKIKSLGPKPTIRCPERHLIQINYKDYVLEIAKSKGQRFYIKRKLKAQENFNWSNRLKISPSHFSYDGNQCFINIYPAIQNKRKICAKSISEILYEYYASVREVKVDTSIINGIINDILNCWPPNFKNQILALDEFDEFKRDLLNYKTLKIGQEHGDFTINNLTFHDNEIYLLDFEFFRTCQPIGFDLFDFYTSINKNYQKNIPYLELNQKKYKLIQRINKLIDSKESVIINENIENQSLKKNWLQFQKHSPNYNLNYNWCRLWCESFSKSNVKIYSIWDNNELKLLAPFIQNKKTLTLIGSEPDYFDNADILYEDQKQIETLLLYIQKQKLHISLKFLDTTSKLYVDLISGCLKSVIKHRIQTSDINPFCNTEKYKPSRKILNDIRRIENKIILDHEVVPEFIFNNKSKHTIDKFIEAHKKRWNGGPFVTQPGFEKFIRSLILNDDSTILSTLQIDEEYIAFHFGYLKDSKLVSSIPAYSTLYSHFSPGKLLLYHLILKCKEEMIQVFDFGRGNEPYKNWFADENKVLINLEIKAKTTLGNFLNNVISN